jgi:integrase
MVIIEVKMDDQNVLLNLQIPRSRPIFGPVDWKRSFNAACKAAGLDDVHFHDLRHTAITRMLEKGISPPLVMKISGHTQQRTFMRYVNQSESSIYDIAMKLDMAA